MNRHTTSPNNVSLTDIRVDLICVLDYLYDDERAHYEALSGAERQGHVFESLQRRKA
jgi:hypothetical protein